MRKYQEETRFCRKIQEVYLEIETVRVRFRNRKTGKANEKRKNLVSAEIRQRGC